MRFVNSGRYLNRLLLRTIIHFLEMTEVKSLLGRQKELTKKRIVQPIINPMEIHLKRISL